MKSIAIIGIITTIILCTMIIIGEIKLITILKENKRNKEKISNLTYDLESLQGNKECYRKWYESYKKDYEREKDLVHELVMKNQKLEEELATEKRINERKGLLYELTITKIDSDRRVTDIRISKKPIEVKESNTNRIFKYDNGEYVVSNNHYVSHQITDIKEP